MHVGGIMPRAHNCVAFQPFLKCVLFFILFVSLIEMPICELNELHSIAFDDQTALDHTELKDLDRCLFEFFHQQSVKQCAQLICVMADLFVPFSTIQLRTISQLQRSISFENMRSQFHCCICTNRSCQCILSLFGGPMANIFHLTLTLTEHQNLFFISIFRVQRPR